ncbi:hypothetical protein [Metabacillus arenae]|uniref:Uncharacterized protein n=1 Tax=Metabacillus arenae TaxID=2771434 RepID=A0A926NF52_9BACI|nr:hypothetical protein [Metabacillus arenae]MBD1380409.1 hypothetical protein [Metabacillus arenae]
MVQFIKNRIVQILCIIGLVSPFIGMKLINFYYFSTLIGWIIGFICFVSAYIIVIKKPDKKTDQE